MLPLLLCSHLFHIFSPFTLRPLPISIPPPCPLPSPHTHTSLPPSSPPSLLILTTLPHHHPPLLTTHHPPSSPPSLLLLLLYPTPQTAGQYKQGAEGQDGVVFSPTATQAKDRYAQDYMNSLNRSRSGSREPRSPNE